MPKKKPTYHTEAEPRTMAGAVPVFCAFDALVDPALLVGNPRNPNDHPEDQIKLLARIIEQSGWRNSITVSRRSGYIVKGHGRLLAARLLGLEKVPVEYQEYATEAEEWADLTADNRLAELAEMNDTKLAELLDEIIQDGSVPMEMTGYTEDDLDALLDSIAGEDPDDAPAQDEEYEPPLSALTKPGDIWLLGKHRLVCGDATREEDIDRLMQGEKAQLVHTDPPYGVSYETQSGAFGMIMNDDMQHDELYGKLLLPVFRLYAKHTIEDAAFYIWHASSTRRDFEDAMTAAGLEEKQYIIWAKNGIVLGHADYQFAHEPCFYASKAGVSPRWFGDRAQHTVWRVSTITDGNLATVLGGGLTVSDGNGAKLYISGTAPKGKKQRYIRLQEGQTLTIGEPTPDSTLWEVSRETDTLHPTQKPVELPKRAIENSTESGDLVIDFFGGSGSTLLAAEITGRRCYTAELDPHYCDVIVSRYVLHTRDTSAVCIRDGQKLRYHDLLVQWAKDNDKLEEVKAMRTPVMVFSNKKDSGEEAE